ncbi:hypothetical protein [Microvirga subterranea]|uniref:hypothetical protein n=1 Tax=Microvirga subterranea TaxID=186651 RepID=UPI000E0CBC79|nr:hypothetical protein [Microvirga subterranea]
MSASREHGGGAIPAVREAALEFVSLSPESLSEARDEAHAIVARRDFWIASATLDAALAGGGTGSSADAPGFR